MGLLDVPNQKYVEQEGIQSNANRPLSDSPCFIVNKFECVCVLGGAVP